MRGSSATNRHMLSPDLTPMIDVVLQLIIFFMLTSSFGDMRRTQVDLPQQRGDEAVATREPSLIIDIAGDDRMLVDSREVSIIELERLARAGLAAAGEADPFDVLIRPDRAAPARELDRVLSRLAAAGVSSWKLGTVAPEAGGGTR